MSTLNSKIILAKNIALDREYINVLNYTTDRMLTLIQSQDHYVNSANNYEFIRPQDTIFVNFTYEDCLKSNYIAFQNTDYSGQWFFAWIDEVKFVNPGACEISYTIDAWSTWFDYWNPKTCFVQREHVNDDTVGINTVQENVNIGQLICDNEFNPNVIGSESYYWFVIACNYNPNNQTRYAGVGSYGNYPQGSMWFAWLVNINDIATSINEISDWVFSITQQSQDANIQTMFALPYQAFSVSDVDENHMVKIGTGNLLNQDVSYTKSIIRKFSNYEPKNNKLLTYPYSFLRVTNNLGSYNDYKIEDFNEVNEAGEPTDEVTFNAIGVPCQGYSGKLRPKNYQGVKYNEDESISMGKYPTLSWSSDGFTNWLTQNAINLGVSAISDAVSGAMTLSGVGSLTNGISNASRKQLKTIGSGVGTVASGVAGSIGSIYQASMIPNTAKGNANAGDISFAQNLNRFKILHMRPKLEYLQIIDDYFTRFGYAINRVKIPNLTGRKTWNYVEIGESEDIGNGSVPTLFMETINSACRKGVTIWHNHSDIGNFNLDNSII